MKTIDYKLMGTRIRKQRELLGYTRETFAEKLDISTKFCADIELGIKGLSIQTLAKISELLSLNVDYILFGENNISNEMNMLTLLCEKCPQEHINELMIIINTFVKAVEKDA